METVAFVVLLQPKAIPETQQYPYIVSQLFHHGTSILAMCLLPPKRASKFGGPQAAEHVVFWHTFDGWNPYIKTNWVTKKKTALLSIEIRAVKNSVPYFVVYEQIPT